jgi:hypothetical protein
MRFSGVVISVVEMCGLGDARKCLRAQDTRTVGIFVILQTLKGILWAIVSTSVAQSLVSWSVWYAWGWERWTVDGGRRRGWGGVLGEFVLCLRECGLGKLVVGANGE